MIAADHSLTATDQPLLLALDQGGHASRALIFDHHGKQLAQAYAPIGTQRPAVDRVEHDAKEILESLRIAINEVASTLGADLRRVTAAGLATQRSSIVCWDAITGEPLSPVLSWQDRRNAALVAQLQPHREAVQRLTGLVLSAHYGASKLRWCLDELPAVQQAFKANRLQCGPLASYLLRGLVRATAGSPTTHLVDPANASRTQLWSPSTGDWSTSLLKWFGVPQSVLPRSVTTRYAYGSLSCATHTVPLTICTGDQAAVPYAAGELRNDSIYLNVGTGAFSLTPLDHDLDAAMPLLRSVLWSDGRRTHYALEGTVNGAGSALQWFGEHSGLDVEPIARDLDRAQLASVPVPLFINGIGGIGSPYWLPNVESRFIEDDIALASDARAKVAAVVESIAFLITANITAMLRRAPGVKRIVAGGGLATCDYLCDCIAALSGLSLVRLNEIELTAKGLAYLIAAQPQTWLHDTHSLQTTPVANPALQARYARWLEHLSRLHHSR